MKHIRYHLPVVHLVLLTLLLCLAPSRAHAQTIYYTNFDNLPGQFTQTNWQGWIAPNGVWQIGTPTAGPGSPHDGTQCAFTTGPGGNYTANQTSNLISPAIPSSGQLPTLSPGQQIVLTFWQWFSWAGSDGNHAPSYGEVQVRARNGTAWGAWKTVSNPASGSNPQYYGYSPGWSLASVDLSAFAGMQIQIGFLHVGGGYTDPGWYIDDVTVVQQAIPYLPLGQVIGFESQAGFNSTGWQGWSADNGIWQIGPPPSKPGPGAAFDGGQCVGTLLAGEPASATGTYPANTSSRLVSPPVQVSSLKSGQQVVLTFWQWFSWGGSDGNHAASYGVVQVSVWNSSTSTWGVWKTVSNPASGSNPQYYGYSPGWSLASVDLSAFAGQQIQIGFVHVGGGYTGPGWYIDDVSVNVVAVQSLPINPIFGNFTSTDQYGWSADNGIWQIDQPTTGPQAAYNGDTQCAGTLLVGSPASATGTYPANTSSRLVSPALNLPSLSTGQQVVLTFWQWFSWAGSDGNHAASYGVVQVSVWNSSTSTWGVWKTVSNPASGSNPQYYGYSPGWSLANVDLSAFAGQQIQIGFVHVGGGYTDPGWYIDDVTVAQQAIPYLPLNQTILFGSFNPTNWYGWSTDNAIWQIGAPTKGPGMVPGDTQCAGTMLAGEPASATGTYPANTSSRLVSPPIDLTAFSSGQTLSLTFAHWFSWAGSDGNHAASYGVVQVSVWNSSTSTWGAWQTLNNGETNNQYTGNSGNLWTPASADLSPYYGQLVQIAFLHVGGGYTDPGWYIDDVEVVTPATAPTITSVTFSSPTTLCPGMTTTGTVTLNEAAPSNTQVTLTYAPGTALSGPSSVTVLAGSSTGTFTVTANAVTANTTVTVTATLGNSSASNTVTVDPWVQSVSVSPTSVVAGSSATETITLNCPAPSGGLVVTLGSNSSVAVPPASVTVPAGATTATATVATYATAATTTVTLSATNQGATQTCTLTVTPGGAKLVLSPTSVTGGIDNSTGFVTLTAPAPAGGAPVMVSSNNSAASVPTTTVTVPAGETTTQFTITTAQVPKTETATITATYGGVSSSAKLTLLPIATLTIIPSTVPGGDNAYGQIILNGELATSNITVTLVSSNPKVASPNQKSVVIPAGSNMATFDISTFPVTKATTVTFTATVNGTKITATLKVTVP